MIRIPSSSEVLPLNREDSHIENGGSHTLPMATGAGGPTYASMHAYLSFFSPSSRSITRSPVTVPPLHPHRPPPFQTMPFSTNSGSHLTCKYVHYCVLVQFLFTSAHLFLPPFRNHCFNRNIHHCNFSCILHSTSRPATEKFDIGEHVLCASFGHSIFDSDAR